MANKNNNKAPAWARDNGERYKTAFVGTTEQKKQHDKAVAELLSGRNKRGSGK